ncbi:hypothetical protein [Rhizobium sp. NLR22b]|uniref:hypothetical protein n=1 Tax=Rhizobium sp. NLR22b TaxID=2731115 RepID=UPI001C835030|nr:hypothetical protein [Rhizobium sp. NLR22b]MBX5238612.1 hypothetical protein [Rhizobium sp. NLR22b]
MLTILSGCAGSIDRRLNIAATAQGEAQAAPQAVIVPDDCRKQEPHAALPEGAEKLSVLDRERDALDRANARVIRCADHIDDFNARQTGGQSTPNADGKNNAR